MALTEGPDMLVRTNRMLLPLIDGFVGGEIAVRDGRISFIAVNGNVPNEDRRGLEVIDHKDDILCPAFYDAHMHLYQWSISRAAVDLSMERSWKGVVAKLKAVATGKSGNELFDSSGLLVGVDYDDSNFTDGGSPSLEQLDRSFGRIPVVIRRICGHILHLNSSAAYSMGIPIARLRDGPLKDDEAMTTSWKIPFGSGSIEKALSAGIRTLWSLGIAGGVEILPESVVGQMFEHFQAIGGGSRLSISVSGRKGRDLIGRCHGAVEWSDIANARDGACSPSLPEVLFEKHFMDGSIGAGTASFSKEFSGLSRSCETLMDRETLIEKVVSGREDGLLPMVHAIGDRAISHAIEALSRTEAPFRIEHSEALTKVHLKALKGTKGCLSLQPNFQRVWGRKGGLYSSRLGTAYLRLNPFRSLKMSGVDWCFGSDMMPPGPLYGMVGAIEHDDPGERLDPITALRGYSERSACFSLRGSSSLGVIREGAWADLVVLKPDLTTVKALYIAGVLKRP
ncbi:MAG: amidohydrolase family protein [Candidatus Thermoplasmatota archaeon]|jgi:hypothetical protein|nr:amidohydrolase family protein [Candidatus Thermoplasmatota archaeon]